MNKPIGKIIRLHEKDNCVVLGENVMKGISLEDGASIINISENIDLGHKVASCLIQEGETVYKYGVSIGSSLIQIQKGDHIHLHNMKSDYLPTFVLSGNEDVSND